MKRQREQSAFPLADRKPGKTFGRQRGPDFFGAWSTGLRHGRYYVLQPTHALLLMLVVGLIFASYRRFRSSSAEAR